MKNLFFLGAIALILIGSVSILSAQHGQDRYFLNTNVEVGVSPVYVKYDEVSNIFHVICSGNDANFNGMYDESTDAYPTWWTVQFDGQDWNAEERLQFDFSSIKTPFRPAIIEATDNAPLTMYIPHPGKIVSYNMETFSVLNDNVGDIDAVAISPSGPSHLFISLRNGENPFSDPGQVIVYNPQTGQILQTIDAGVNVQQTAYYDPSEAGLSFAILNEGSFGSENSILQIGEIVHMGNFELNEIELGNGGNHIEVAGDRMFVTVNGSHKVLEIDLNSKSVVGEIDLPTTGFDGPRESRVISDDLFISTYDGRIFHFPNYMNNQTSPYQILAADKIEGFDVGNDDIIVAAAPYNRTDYSPNNDVNIFMKEESNKEYIIDRIDLRVGSKPIYSFYNEIHELVVFCQGLDINGDGVFNADLGEEASSVWVIEGVIASEPSNYYLVEKIHDFEYFLHDEFNPAVDYSNDIIYLNHQDRVMSYNMNDYTDNALVFELESTGLSLSGPSHIFVSMPPESDDIYGRVEVKSIQTGVPLQTVNAYENVSKSSYYTPSGGSLSFAVLNKGQKGADNAILQLGEILHMQDFELDEIQLGDYANDITFENSYSSFGEVNSKESINNIYATVQGSRELIQINAMSHDIVRRLDLSEVCSEENGPRETEIFHIDYDESIFGTSTYDGNFLISDDFSEVNEVVNLPGKGDAISKSAYMPVVTTFNDYYLQGTAPTVCIPYEKNSEEILDLITILKLNLGYSSVEATKQPDLTAYPNPARDFVSLNNFDASLFQNIEVYNSTGILVLESENMNNSIDVSNLNPGVYFIKLTNNSEVKTVPFSIAR